MFKKRVYTLRCVCMVVLVLLCMRLAHIGIISGKSYETMAQNQQYKKQTVKYNRGAIYDRNGTVLTDTEDVLLRLGGDGLVGGSDGTAYEFFVKKRFSSIASHVIGYTDSDGNGVSGAEKLYNDFLKSSSQVYLSYMTDASGNPVRDYSLQSDTPPDHAVKLTLDAQIQKICETAADKYIKKGAIVMLDVQSFDVLASVSRPAFKPEDVALYRDSENGELLNRVLMPYNAGSVFKIVTTAAAIEKNAENLKRKFDCRGSFCPDKQHRFYCHKKDGHGIVDFKSAFASSCNCAFYAVTLDIGANTVIDKAFDFGMGSKLLNSSLGEFTGNLPVRTKYTPAETLNIAIGQGEILITPLQCATMVATVAGGGVRKCVNVVSGFGEKNKFTDARNRGELRVISKETAGVICDMMRSCVTKGTGYEASGSKVCIAGKTGSAETGIPDKEETQVHGWFCGFFPFDSPKYAVAVFSENGKTGSNCIKPFVEIAENVSALCG